ncbi:MAG: glycosyltransferase [Bdellovibrionales bacterium]
MNWESDTTWINQPKISVSMITKDNPNFIFDALRSIHDQNHKNIEILIVDDGSSKLNYDLLKDYAATHGNIKLHRNSRNLGIPASRNISLGMMSVESEFLCVLDADDIWLPNKLEKQLSVFKENPDLDILGTAIELIDKNSNPIGKRKYPVEHNQILNHLYLTSPLCHSSVVIRLRNLGTKVIYNEEYKSSQDLELWTRLALEGYQFRNLPEVLVKYRVYEEQTTGLKTKRSLKFSLKARWKYILKKPYPLGFLLLFAQSLLYLLPSTWVIKIRDLFFHQK